MNAQMQRAELLFSLGGACPGDIPFRYLKCLDVSRPGRWGTALLEVWVPDEQHARYWPQAAVRLVRQDLSRLPGNRLSIRAEVQRVVLDPNDPSVSLGDEALWVAHLDPCKLLRALRWLEHELETRRQAWNLTPQEIAGIHSQDALLAAASNAFKRMNPEIEEVPDGPESPELDFAKAESAALRCRVADLEAELAETRKQYTGFRALVETTLTALGV
jgi:hypothetical protein